MTLSSLNPFTGVVADFASVTVGFDALAVEDGGRGLLTPALVGAHADSQRIVEGRPSLVQTPGSEDMVDSLPRRVSFRQKPPRDATLENIQNRINHAPALSRSAAELLWSGNHRLQEFPLRVRQVSFVGSDIHRPDSGCAENAD